MIRKGTLKQELLALKVVILGNELSVLWLQNIFCLFNTIDIVKYAVSEENKVLFAILSASFFRFKSKVKL